MKKKIQLPLWLVLCVKVLISAFAVQKSALVSLEWGYDVDLPIAKWFFSIFQSINGWGIETVFFYGSVLFVFYKVSEHPLQKSRLISVLSALAGICMVVGRSYEDLGTWDYIFNGRLQMGLAAFVAAGYYLLYKNMIIFGACCLQKWDHSRTECKSAVETFLFEKHPFGGALAVIMICSLPFLIFFWPGTLQWDAHAQLWAYFGQINWDNRYPIFITWYSGKCMEWGRLLAGSDSLGLFFFTFPQYIAQWFVFSYGMYLLKKLNTPIIWRWLSLIYLTLFPAWRIWGYTVAKDTYYYICALLAVLILIDIHISGNRKPLWWQWFLLCFSALLCCLVRPNGILLISVTMVGMLFFDRKRWMIYITALAISVISNFTLNYTGEHYWGIAPVPTRESLSLPLQQTARYLKYHHDELTEREKEVLQGLFDGNIYDLPYNPEIVDSVKLLFSQNASKEEVSEYLEVWAGQFLKHPNTYVQAFLNQTYGYFYPNRIWNPEWNGTYYLGIKQHWEDEVMDVQFGIENQEMRDFYRNVGDFFWRIPVVGMLYSCGLQNYIIIGCIAFLCYHKKKRELFILLPSVATVVMCILSPANAFLRYMLPVMVLLPFNIAWCYYSVHEEINFPDSQ